MQVLKFDKLHIKRLLSWIYFVKNPLPFITLKKKNLPINKESRVVKKTMFDNEGNGSYFGYGLYNYFFLEIMKIFYLNAEIKLV